MYYITLFLLLFISCYAGGANKNPMGEPGFKHPAKDPKALFDQYVHEWTVNQREPDKKELFFILKKMDNEALWGITQQSFESPLKSQVLFYAGRIFFSREKFKESYSLFKKFLRSAEDSHRVWVALKYIQALQSLKRVNRKKIGALLPLTGPSAKIGKRVLMGLKMGLGFYRPQKSPFQLVVFDSGGQAGRVRKKLRELVVKHHVIAVVGGVPGPSAQALAEEAEGLGLPVVLMSHRSDVAQLRPYVFQNALTSHLISEKLVHFLMNNLKVRKFALLYPNDSYGVDYANAFWQAVENKGGTITGVQIYKPGQTDFNGPLSRLTGTYYMEDREEEYREQLKQKYTKNPHLKPSRVDFKSLLPPAHDFEALFIPDSIQTFNLIAPHIVYNDINDVYLVGTNLWNQEQALKRKKKYLNETFFVDLSLSLPAFQKTDFYKTFVSVFNQRPGLFEIQAYEAGVVFRQVIAGGAKTRKELREKLSRIKEFHGPLGPVSLTPEGQFRHTLRVFHIENKKIKPVSPSYTKKTRPNK